jgi:outer membrane protein assembly factor BamB
MVLLALLLVTSFVSADGSSLLRLNGERNVPVSVFDIRNASKERLDDAEPRLDTSASPIYSDSDGDGFPEIYYCSIEGQFIQYLTADDSYHVLLEDESASFIKTPQLVDLDHDGSLEVLLFDGTKPSIRCFDLASGEEEWSISNPSEGGGISPMPKVWTVEGSNESRVLVILYPGTVVMLDGQGKEVWRHRIENVYEFPLDPYRPTISIADLDLDGDLEMVVYSTKANGGGLPLPDLDVFSLDPPKWLTNYSIPGNATTGSAASSMPLLVDIFQNDGLEIIVGTTGGGLAAVLSEDGTVAWYHRYEEVWDWRSLGLVRTENGTFITASYEKGIYVLKNHGQTVYQKQWVVDSLTEPPLVAYCEPGSPSQALIFGAGHTLYAVDAETGRSIWIDRYDSNSGRFRMLMMRGRDGVSVELHVFFDHSRSGGADPENLHYRYWIPEEEDREIVVDPNHYTWYPNISLLTRGILIDGAPGDIRWVMVRLYQGDATDQFAMDCWPSHLRKMESWGIYGIRVDSSGFGIDGMDEEHSWVAMEIQAPWYYVQFGNVHLHVTVYYPDGKAISVRPSDIWTSDTDVAPDGSS